MPLPALSAKIARLLSTLLKAASLLTVLFADLYVAYLTQKMKTQSGIPSGFRINPGSRQGWGTPTCDGRRIVGVRFAHPNLRWRLCGFVL